jgi:hypothetical protein
MSGLYSVLASVVLGLHLIFVLWVALGASLVYSRPKLRWLHIICLVWGMLVELLPWPCPLTLLENWLEFRAGIQAYRGGFLLHYLDATVYPNISPAVLTTVGVAVCIANLGLYGSMLYGRFKPHD